MIDALVEDAEEEESPDGHQGFLAHEGRDLLLVHIPERPAHLERPGLSEPHDLPERPGLSEPHALPQLPVHRDGRECGDERGRRVRREEGGGDGESSSGQDVGEGTLCNHVDHGAGVRGVDDDEGSADEWRHERDRGRERSRSRDE